MNFFTTIQLATRQKLFYSSVFFVLCGVLLFFNSTGGEFIGDDFVLIANNTAIHQCSFENARMLFTRSFFDVSNEEEQGMSGDEGYYRPLTMISYMIDYALWGALPTGYHYTNIMLHILSCIVLFFILYSLTEDISLAFFSTTLFLMHPLTGILSER